MKTCQNSNLQLHSARALLDRKLFVVAANVQAGPSRIRIIGYGKCIGDALNDAYDRAETMTELMTEVES